MERITWTDERLDDMSAEVRELRREMRSGFEATNRRVDNLGNDMREEMRAGFGALRVESRADVTGLRGDFEALRLTMLRVGGGIMVGLVGVIVAILARGV